jgi:hypothetical protein
MFFRFLILVFWILDSGIGELNGGKFFFFDLGTLLINVFFLFFFLGMFSGFGFWTGIGIE